MNKDKVNTIRRVFLSVLTGTLLVVCLFGCGKDTASYVEAETAVTESESESVTQQEIPDQSESEPTMFYIYVCGAVQCPGVYQMPEGSRIFDIFSAAGGLTPEAAGEYWNQARLLVDGEMIYVPTVEEAAERDFSAQEISGGETEKKSAENKININTASKEELMTIPGIGESKALAILAYREEHGAFSKIEDVMNVEGIKDGVFAKMKEYIVVN